MCRVKYRATTKLGRGNRSICTNQFPTSKQNGQLQLQVSKPASNQRNNQLDATTNCSVLCMPHLIQFFVPNFSTSSVAAASDTAPPSCSPRLALETRGHWRSIRASHVAKNVSTTSLATLPLSNFISSPRLPSSSRFFF